MTAAIIILLVTHLLLPVLLIFWVSRSEFSGKTTWLISVLGVGAYFASIFLTGRWDWVGYPLRFLLPVAFLVAAFVSLRRLQTKGSPWWSKPASLGEWANSVASAFLIVFFGLSIVQSIGGLSPEDPAAQLSFPLEGGISYIAQGGDSTALNYHNADRAQHYAVDVSQLTAVGTRAWGLYPAEPDRYAVFGRAVVSPCSGKVLSAEGGLKDLRPPGSDPNNPAGNHVVVRCVSTGGEPAVDVLLAHLQEDSVTVNEGDKVKEEQRFGLVGNSGNTTEPHLHIHAVRSGSGSILKGEGVPIRFDGRFLVRNGIVF